MPWGSNPASRVRSVGGAIHGPAGGERRTMDRPEVPQAPRVVVKLTGAGGESRFAPDYRGGGGMRVHIRMEP